VPNGTDTCAKPGTGPGQCGAGIPAGPKLAFNLIYNTTSPTPSLVEDLASNAKAAGIVIALSGSNFNFMIQNYNDAASPANANKWAVEDFGGETNSTYPTQFGFLNTGGSGQIGNYSDPRADALINASTSGTNPAAVTAEASSFTTQLPVLWQPVRDRVWTWKTKRLGDRPERVREPDPVRRHTGILVHDQVVAERHAITPAGLAFPR
jgi:peptide/nickel transport system substrate-binding protein